MLFGQGSQSHLAWCRRFIASTIPLIVLSAAAFVAADTPFGTAPVSNTDQHIVTRIYAAKQALVKTCDAMQCTMDQAKQRVQTHVVGSVDDEIDTSTVRTAWFGDELIVRQSIAAHRQTAKQMKSIRKSGLKQAKVAKSPARFRPDDHSVSGPLTQGKKLKSVPVPTDEQVLKLLRVQNQGGVPMLHETQLNNVKIIKEKIADYVDPPRFYPMIGEAQMHHAHYKCTVHFDRTTKVGYPVPSTTTEKQVTNVVYIDHNHLHVFPDEELNAKESHSTLPAPYLLKDDVQYFANETDATIKDGGVTLPSPYYLEDDVQYFPAGPEFKLTN